MRYVIATLLFCLAGIFSLPLSAQTSTSADSTSVTGHDIVKVAMKYIGVPYKHPVDPFFPFPVYRGSRGEQLYRFAERRSGLFRRLTFFIHFNRACWDCNRCESVYRYFLFHPCQPHRHPHLFFGRTLLCQTLRRCPPDIAFLTGAFILSFCSFG